MDSDDFSGRKAVDRCRCYRFCMMNMIQRVIELSVPESKEKERLDLLLSRQLPSVTRARLKRMIDEGFVTVDGRTRKAGHTVRPGERIEVRFPAPEPATLEPEAIPLNVIYEDPNLLVVDKPAGMVVHPAFGNKTGTLVNALLHHSAILSQVGGESRPGLVHRLDKDTSGLLVVAKDDVTHVGLARQLSERKMEREYRAVIWGRPRKLIGRIEAPLARSTKDRTRMVVNSEGKNAVTHYSVLEPFSLLSYIMLKLETGRTHQIRVHMASIGHPVFADATYGGRGKQLAGLSKERSQFAFTLLKSYRRQMLHARTLSFIHPIRKELMRFEAPIPEDMKRLLSDLRNAPV